MAWACAGPQLKADGHLVQHHPGVAPATWQRPMALSSATAVELTEGVLSASEAAELAPACRAAAGSAWRSLGGTTLVPPDHPGPLLVMSSVTVDVTRSPRGQRRVRVRAVGELSRRGRPLALAVGEADLSSSVPALFRQDGVRPSEVHEAVAAACRRAGQLLRGAHAAAVPADRERARRELVAGESPVVRQAAALTLMQSADDADTEALLQALSDQDPVVRRMAARALGRAGGGPAARALGRLSVADPDPAVAREAHGAALDLCAMDPSLESEVSAGRRAAGAPAQDPP